jgi:hypothetical protein
LCGCGVVPARKADTQEITNRPHRAPAATKTAPRQAAGIPCGSVGESRAELQQILVSPAGLPGSILDERARLAGRMRLRADMRLHPSRHMADVTFRDELRTGGF